MTQKDLVVIGAGPAGLAAAIAAQKSGLDYLVLERGVLVNAIFRFPTNMVFFTTPELLEIGGFPFITPYEKPTRLEALRYYRRVVDALDLSVSFGESVMAVSQGEHGLSVETLSDGDQSRVIQTKTVILATGSYEQPNLLNIPGENLSHVSHYYREAHSYYRKRVVVVGGKNSAAETALDLYRNGARVTLVHRQACLSEGIKYWVLPDIENRIKEESIDGRFKTRVIEIRATSVVIECAGVQEEIPADAVFLLTGYRPDTDLLTRCGIRFDSETCIPEYDEKTFETNVPNLFLAGQIVAGVHGGKVFIENGRFHGESVVAGIVERLNKDEVPSTV